MNAVSLFTNGTYRECAPEETLVRIKPLLPTMGITRFGDNTGLAPDFGVSCAFAVRPAARVLQVSAGKGISPEHARVSALMESIEMWHAEQQPKPQLWTSLTTLHAACEACVIPIARWPEQLNTAWVRGLCYLTQRYIWVPTGAAYFTAPSLVRTNTNGLASGNSWWEACFHALTELMERDAVANLAEGDQMKIQDRCQVIEPLSIEQPNLREAIKRAASFGSKWVLLAVPSRFNIPVFWAVLMDRHAPFAVSRFNVGYGCHLDASIAMSRAITEAVQSRLTFIQGTREDLIAKPVMQVPSENESVFDYFEQLQPTATFETVASTVPNASMETHFQNLLNRLRAADITQLAAIDLSHSNIGIDVVKLIAPELRSINALF